MARNSLVAGMLGDERLDEAHAALAKSSAFEPLSRDAGEVEAWRSWQLASLIEGRFQEQVEVRALSAEARNGWLVRVASADAGPISPHDGGTVPYWLMHRGQRVGTLSLGRFTTSWLTAEVSNLFVHPEHRRLGVASRALHVVNAAVALAGGSGLSIPTPWTWQPAVRFLAARRLWVQGWKHALLFALRRDLPEYHVRIRGRRARFVLAAAGRSQVLIECDNLGHRLGYRELPALDALRAPLREVASLAPGTLAVHLALAGWPLIRSDDDWRRRHEWSDSGMPEGLAYKVAVFEARDRQSGYRVQTPRIAGLPYEEGER